MIAASAYHLCKLIDGPLLGARLLLVLVLAFLDHDLIVLVDVGVLDEVLCAQEHVVSVWGFEELAIADSADVERWMPVDHLQVLLVVNIMLNVILAHFDATGFYRFDWIRITRFAYRF